MTVLSAYVTEIEKHGILSIKYVPVKEIVGHFVQGISTILTKAINDETIQRACLEFFNKEKFDKRSRKDVILQCGGGHNWEIVCNLVQGAKEKYSDVLHPRRISSPDEDLTDFGLLKLSASLEDTNGFDDEKKITPSTSQTSSNHKGTRFSNKQKQCSNRPRKRIRYADNYPDATPEKSVKRRLGPPKHMTRSPIEYVPECHDGVHFHVLDEWRPHREEFHSDSFGSHDESCFRRNFYKDSSY